MGPQVCAASILDTLAEIQKTLSKIEETIGTTDPVSDKIVQLAKENPDNIALNTFDPAYYSSLNDDDKAALLRILNSGIENVDSGMGCYACVTPARWLITRALPEPPPAPPSLCTRRRVG